MAGIGIVTNPRAWRNLVRPETAGHLKTLLGNDGELAEARTPEELAAVAKRFRESSPDLVAVNGGDGTAHRVADALAKAFGKKPLPPLALLPGGAMNTLASAHGIHGSPEGVLAWLVGLRRASRPFRTVERDLLRIEADGGPARHGFLLGTGCVVSFLEAYAAGPPSRWRALALLLRSAASCLVRGAFARTLAREKMRVLADGEEWAAPEYLALLAGTIPEVGLGFRPLARCAEQPGFFQVVGITASAPRLALSLPAIRLGRPWHRRVAVDAVVHELAIEPEGPLRFTVDGELHRAERSLRVGVGPPVRVVVGAAAIDGSDEPRADAR
jgi:diacylglycerol kinase family enzyme